MSGRAPERPSQDALVPLAGRRNEVKALASAMRGRRSCLVYGPAGIGKTRLIAESLEASRQPSVTLHNPRVLHQFLVELAQSLSCPPGPFGDVRLATSAALKPAALKMLQENPCCVVLEDVADADPRMYRFLQQVYYIPRVCLIVSVTSPYSLGHLRKLLWDPREHIAVKPLSRPESLTLFEAACDAFRLDSLEVDGFRAKVLAAARGNPGQILTMCRLASLPEYHRGRHIMFLPLRIDALAAFVS